MVPPDPRAGVFTTLRTRDGRIQALDAHLRRLEHSVRALYGVSPPDHLASAAAAAVPAEGTHRLRIVARPFADDPRRLSVAVEAAPLDAAQLAAPVRLLPVTVSAGLGAHKWFDRGRLDVLAEPGTEPLLLDAAGGALEVAWGNVWIREGDRIVTPPLDGRILPGVTRARLLDLAPSLGLAASAEAIDLARARAADEVFVTASLRLAVSAAIAPADAPPASSTVTAEIARGLAAGEWQPA